MQKYVASTDMNFSTSRLFLFRAMNVLFIENLVDVPTSHFYELLVHFKGSFINNKGCFITRIIF